MGPVDHLSVSAGVSGQTDELHCMDNVACRPIIKCGRTGCAGWCPSSVVEHGYQVGKKEASHVPDLRDDFSRATTSLCPISCPKLVKGKRETAVTVSLLPRLDVPGGFLGATCRVSSRPTRRIPMSRRVPVRPLSRHFTIACVFRSWCSK